MSYSKHSIQNTVFLNTVFLHSGAVFPHWPYTVPAFLSVFSPLPIAPFAQRPVRSTVLWQMRLPT